MPQSIYFSKAFYVVLLVLALLPTFYVLTYFTTKDLKLVRNVRTWRRDHLHFLRKEALYLSHSFQKQGTMLWGCFWLSSLIRRRPNVEKNETSHVIKKSSACKKREYHERLSLQFLILEGFAKIKGHIFLACSRFSSKIICMKICTFQEGNIYYFVIKC